jgi:hypothetical protein
VQARKEAEARDLATALALAERTVAELRQAEAILKRSRPTGTDRRRTPAWGT